MRVVIIEDEVLSAEYLADLLQKFDSSIQIIAQFDSVKKSVASFQSGLEADLLFFDIHLADGLSFEILAKHPLEAPIIFTTAYDEYAIKAFKHNSIDYLLKPIGMSDLSAALDKFHRFKQPSQLDLIKQMGKVYQQLSKSYKSRFMVKSGQSIDSINTSQIIHFQLVESISFLVGDDGKRYPVDYSMDDLEDLVSPADFFRINRKVIIRISSIQKVSSYLNSRLYVHAPHLTGDLAVVSRDRVNDFKSWLDA